MSYASTNGRILFPGGSWDNWGDQGVADGGVLELILLIKEQMPLAMFTEMAIK